MSTTSTTDVSSRSRPLSAVDAAWLRMDRPSNLMMITAMLEVEGRLGLEALDALVRTRLLVHPRFTQRVVTRLGRPTWVKDPYFTVASHLHRVGLPAPGGESELRELVGDLMSTPLDRTRPLWQVHVIEDHRGGSVVVARLHHCIADGVALVRLLLSLTDHEGDAEAPGVGVKPAPARGVLGRLRRGGQVAASLVRDLTLPADPDTALRGALGERKVPAWSRPLPLLAVSTGAHVAGATVTDALTAALAGALRRYLQGRGETRPDVEVRALVPVNVRGVVGDGGRGGDDAGNRFGLVYLPLPLGAPTPEERLAQVRERMARIKASPEAIMGYGVIGAMGLASVTVERLGIELFTQKASVMITSVPGPSRAVRLAGRPVRGMTVWAPASGQMGLTCSFVSYAGAVRLGVAADALVVPDPERIVAAFEDEARALGLTGPSGAGVPKAS
jgi:WS/DGAT/MGAT family acyltransferase